ncbi:hypothetical protein [Terrisporobacter petrolearius]|uniref:hypothetical protein n=1 Tax=Terrisporobacter petrolearius TaxID=1460447 RepID=UPI0031CC8476
MNNCCCTHGMKYAICILEDLIALETLIDKYRFFYACGSSDGSLKNSKYPNFLLLEEEIIQVQPPNKIKSINLCIDDIDYIKIEPKEDQSGKIINELNKYYISPSVLQINCDENCCCKNSAISFMKDKYMNLEWANRQFIVGLKENNYIIPEIQPDPQNPTNFVTVIHMDYDIAWLWDQQKNTFYLVSLCKICSLIDIK